MFPMGYSINVTRPVKINHVNANYTKLCFAYILSSKCSNADMRNPR